jgi:hypothetical protein
MQPPRRAAVVTRWPRALVVRARRAAAALRYRPVDLAALTGRLSDLHASPEAAAPGYWKRKPAPSRTYVYPAHPTVGAGDVEEVAHLQRGEFRGSPRFEWRPLGVPPPWDANPENNRTWDFYRHTLRWTVPLIKVAAVKGDDGALQLAVSVMKDWIIRNSPPPGQSAYAWRDNVVAMRLFTLAWFWEIWRRSDAFDTETATLFLASIYQHARFLCDPRNYRARSNHGLDMNGALLAAAVTFPEFRDAAKWRAIAAHRLAAYAATNFSPGGFHLEEAPAYHWFVTTRIAEMLGFARANGLSLPPTLNDTLARACAVYPYLRLPDGTIAHVGDSSLRAGGADWRQCLQRLLGAEIPPVAASTAPNPRQDGSSFLLDSAVGYAIFTGYRVGGAEPEPDTYALFRCNSFRSGHEHQDALSFLLYGLGREWLVDSGYLNMEEHTPERQYMRCSRAHNVVEVDDEAFGIHPVSLTDWGRTGSGDFVTAQHDLASVRHTRTFRLEPPYSVRITDVLEATGGTPHIYSQLFHVAPGLSVEQVRAERMELSAADGGRCLIEQSGSAGEWKVVCGQKTPYLQGWYSSDFNQLEASPVVSYSSGQPATRWVFTTRIWLERGR